MLFFFSFFFRLLISKQEIEMNFIFRHKMIILMKRRDDGAREDEEENGEEENEKAGEEEKGDEKNGGWRNRGRRSERERSSAGVHQIRLLIHSLHHYLRYYSMNFYSQSQKQPNSMFKHNWGRTDGRTDMTPYRDALSHLKSRREKWGVRKKGEENIYDLIIIVIYLQANDIKGFSGSDIRSWTESFLLSKTLFSHFGLFTPFLVLFFRAAEIRKGKGSYLHVPAEEIASLKRRDWIGENRRCSQWPLLAVASARSLCS